MKDTVMTVECERRFLVSLAAYPSEISNLPSRQIEQCYLPETGKWQVRARKIVAGDIVRHYLTMKQDLSLGTVHEIEQEATAETWEQIKFAAGAVLAKTRSKMPLSCGHVLEIDRYQDATLLPGFAVAEVEMANLDSRVELPHWLGEEITGNKAFSNRTLFNRIREAA